MFSTYITDMKQKSLMLPEINSDFYTLAVKNVLHKNNHAPTWAPK